MTSPLPGPALRRWPFWAMAVGLAAALAMGYHNTWRVPFLFDDITAIPRNQSLTSFRNALHPPADTTVSGRPVLNLSFALNRALGGDALPGYHAVNLTILWAGALLLFDGTRRIVRRRGAKWERDADAFAAVVALIWALHPLQTESITYVVQRAESLMALWYLASLYAVIRTAESESSRGRALAWALLAGATCWLGMATKEVAVSIPVISILMDRCFFATNWAEIWRRRGGMYGGMAASWLLSALLVAGTHGRSGTAGFDLQLSRLRFARTEVYAVMRYLRLAFIPTGQVFDYGTYWVDRPQLWIPAGAGVAGLAALIAWNWWRGRPVGWLGLWFFAVLAPTLIIPGARQTMAEHRMYLALAPVALMIGGALWQVAGRWAGWVLLGAAVALGFATERRNRAYASDESIWTNTVERLPDNPYAQNNLGLVRFKAGDDAGAERCILAALRLKPDYADAWNNLGAIRQHQNRLAESRAAIERSLQLEPRGAEVHVNYSDLLRIAGEIPAAYAEIQRALQIDPTAPEVSTILGNVLLAMSRLPEAEAAYRQALKLDPADWMAYNGLASVLLKENHPAEALAAAQTALRINPRLGVALANLGEALWVLGRGSEANQAYIQAEAASPDSADIRYNHGRILYHQGDFAAAARSYAEAVRLNPQMGLAHYNWAIALYHLGQREAAIQQFALTASLMPDYAEAHNNYGVVLLTLQRPKEALIEFERAKQLAPQTAGVEGNLAAARRALSR